MIIEFFLDNIFYFKMFRVNLVLEYMNMKLFVDFMWSVIL